MYTTRTKMLFNQLPGAIVYDQENEQYTTPMEWRSDAFKPTEGAHNQSYLIDRAISHIRQHPPVLREPYTDLQPAHFELRQPDGALLTILPRIFECLRCGRLHTFRVSDNPDERNQHFARGFFCKACRNRSQFEQISLVWVHQCGYMGQPRVQPCDRHKYDHLYLDRRGTQQPTEYRVRCMGPSGSTGSPQCSMPPARLTPGEPGNHSMTSCPISRADGIGDLPTESEVRKLAEEFQSSTVRIRPSQDPVNFYAVGLDVVNPSIEIPEGIHHQDETINRLLEAHIRGDRLNTSDLREIFKATGVENERLQSLRKLIATMEGQHGRDAIERGGKDFVDTLWKVLRSTAQGHDIPATYDEAVNELSRGTAAVRGAISLVKERGDKEDATSLVDQLIETSHLTSTGNDFTGLDATLQLLLEHERVGADEFADGRGRLRRAGFEDVLVSSNFDIVRLQVGFVRNTYDISRGVLVPFKERNRPKIPIYARQSSTEAILFRLDPVRVVRWVHDQFQGSAFQKLENPAGATQPEARRWLLENIDFRAFQSYDPIRHEPTRELFQLIHTMSHLFMRASSHFSGIDASGMKELIYPALPGFIIYKSQHGDFTLGGLATLYEENLASWFDEVQVLAQECPNDPICRNGRMRDTTHAAACYACLAGNELSCVHFNRDLDRATLTGTVPQRRDQRFGGFWGEGP